MRKQPLPPNVITKQRVTLRNEAYAKGFSSLEEYQDYLGGRTVYPKPGTEFLTREDVIKKLGDGHLAAGALEWNTSDTACEQTAEVTRSMRGRIATL